MKRAFSLLLSLSALLGFASCGNSEDYKYTFGVNGCSTGEQKTSSLVELCERLKDDAANNYCAESSRKDYFDQRCGSSGVRWGTASVL